MFERCQCSFGPESSGSTVSPADMYKPAPLLQQLRIPHFLEVDMTASGGHQRIQRAKRPRDLKGNLNSFARPASSSSSLPLGAVNSTVCCITARSTPRSALTSGFRRSSVLALVSVGLCPVVSGEYRSERTNEPATQLHGLDIPSAERAWSSESEQRSGSGGCGVSRGSRSRRRSGGGW